MGKQIIIYPSQNLSNPPNCHPSQRQQPKNDELIFEDYILRIIKPMNKFAAKHCLISPMNMIISHYLPIIETSCDIHCPFTNNNRSLVELCTSPADGHRLQRAQSLLYYLNMLSFQVQNQVKLVKYKVEKEVNKGKNGQNEINKSFMYMQALLTARLHVKLQNLAQLTGGEA